MFVLAIDVLGHVWLGASRAGHGHHTVGRLTRASAGSWQLDGFVNGAGSLHRDGAYANEEGVSLAIVDGPQARIAGYTVADLHPHRGLEPWF